jgi:hypothetical protein
MAWELYHAVLHTVCQVTDESKAHTPGEESMMFEVVVPEAIHMSCKVGLCKIDLT